MTAMEASAVADHLGSLALPEQQREHVRDTRPNSHADEQADYQAELRSPATDVGSRLYHATVLSAIGLAEIAWFSAVGYIAFRLFA